MLSLRLTISNLKKKKEASIILCLFILCSVMFLNLGTSVNSQAQQIYYDKCEIHNAPHFIAPCNTSTYRTEFETFIQSYPGVISFEKEETLYMTTTQNNKNNLELGAYFFNLDNDRNIEPFTLVEEDTSIPRDSAIYVPIQLKHENVLLGDTYTLTYKGSDYSFQVAGYFESTYYCNTNCGFYKYYLPSEVYERIVADIGHAYLLSARFEGTESEVSAQSAALKAAFLKDTSYTLAQEYILQEALAYDDMKECSLSNIQLGVLLLCSVAFLICIVVLIVILNNIRESMEESMVSIGVLESLGYTSRQIMNSYCLEFLPLAVIGSLFGTLASYLATPLLRSVLSGICGFEWILYLHLGEDIFCSIAVILAIYLTSYFAVRRLHHLPPVDALNHRSKKQSTHKTLLPLHKGFSSINLSLAVKNLFTHGKSNLVYTVIVAIGSFTIGITLVLFFNFSLDHDKLLKSTGIELSDLQVTVTAGTDVEKFAEELQNYDEVRKVNLCEMNTLLKYKDESIKTIVTEHFENLEVVTPFTGSYPENENEVVISYMLSKNSGKGVGDSITLSYQGYERNYLISGIYSSMNGDMVLMSLSGFRELDPVFQIGAIDVYLNSGISSAEFKETLQSIYKVSVDNESSSVAEQRIANLLADYGITSASFSIWQDGVEIYSGDSSAFRISQIEDLKSFASGQMDSYANMLSSLVIIIFLTTVLIIACILRITLKSAIQKNRLEYGVLKSMGYTSGDIIKQLSVSYLITSVIGSILGALLADIGAAPLFQLLYRAMGVSRMEITSHPVYMAIYSILLGFILYLSSILISRRVRKITAYELLTE